MNAQRIASSFPQAATSSGIAPAQPKITRVDNPSVGFASLKQERTVEAKVSTQLLTLTKGGMAKGAMGSMAMGGATQNYQVPDELMALAGRKKAELASSQPPVEEAALSPSAAGVGAAVLAPSLPPPAALPSIAVAAPQRTFNWLVVSVVAYVLLCAVHWAALH